MCWNAKPAYYERVQAQLSEYARCLNVTIMRSGVVEPDGPGGATRSEYQIVRHSATNDM